MTETAIGWLVFGRDSAMKPYGAAFESDEGEIAAKAAEAMGYHLLEAKGPQAEALAKQLPTGRAYATGKGFAPLIKQALYDELAKLKEAQEPGSMQAADDAHKQRQDAKAAAAEPGEYVAPPPVDVTWWSGVAMGSEVLSTAPGVEGWSPCEVVGVSEQGKMLTLRWKGYEGEPAFMIPRSHVGLVQGGAA